MNDSGNSDAKRTGRQRINAQEARGGDVILRSRRRRAIFLAGLAGFVILSALGGLALTMG